MNLRPDSTQTHPSFLALDRAHLGHASLEVTAHLDGCEACRLYVESPESPATSTGFAAVRDVIEQQRRFRFPRFFAFASLAAATCGLVLVLTQRTPRETRDEQSYIGVKGFRSVWIYVKRGTETELWDGKRPVASGDRLRLKVDFGGYRHVAIYSLDDVGRATRLFAGGRTQGQNFTLPDAWEVDDSSEPERLFVIFSDEPFEPNWSDIRAGKAQPGVAVLPFMLPKANGSGIDAGPLGP